MAISAVQTYLSPEEYITLERKAKPDANTVRNEYIQGKIIAMSGASFTHNLIKGNIFVQLHNRLIESSCVVFANEMRVGIPSAKSYFYPDVGVVCDEPRFEDNVFDTLLNPIVIVEVLSPIVIVEVLSPSTEGYDRGEKFSRYRQPDSLKEYILVSQDSVNVERFLRKRDEWSYTFFQALEQHLPLTSLQCELPLQEIYGRVTFPEASEYGNKG